jgi:hypothetical protein
MREASLTMTTATSHAARLAINFVITGAAIAVIAHYHGLIAPAAVLGGLWFGMIGLAHVHPRLATLLYCAACGALGLRPWRW